MTAVQEPEYMDCPAGVVGGLVETISTALLDNFPKLSADESDIELVLDALHVLRPHVAEINALDGVLQMTRSNWDSAIHILRDVCNAAPQFGQARALLAYCLSMKNDPEWKRFAEEALEISPSTDTRYLVQALQARDDLTRAVEAAQNGAEFVVPDSVARLTALANTDGVTREQPDTAQAQTQLAPDASMYSFRRA
ncbi:type III secretion protein [Burkholderia singularis]|uniref:Type III secretion protein n=2 Tax=Burkholderia singularis TaxID=1503053 RepID=A0A103DWV0_9BURK|nr:MULTISPECIES: HrpB1 family type III secretion system apparatus protein [Burkholderia]KVE24182.1 type III secretion protein [Burkholderia singularis]